jgi:putative ABC transport system permease protein
MTPSNNGAPRPPRLAERLLRISVLPDGRDVLLGDFAEFYSEIRARSGRIRAAAWYWSQALKSLPKLIPHLSYWSFVMIRNYLTVVLRHMRSHKANSLINTLGLAIGIACCILIFFFVQDELSFDRFHEHVDTIFEVKGTLIMGNMRMGVDAQPPLGPTLPERFPEILDAVRITREEHVMKAGNALGREKGIAADPGFFEMFTFPLLDNASLRALEDPQAVVLTERLAGKYFGARDPVGLSLAIRLNDEYQDFRVAAVVGNVPEYSSLRFDFVLNLEKIYGDDAQEWNSGKHIPTFVRLARRDQAESLVTKFPDTIDKQFIRQFDEKSGYFLQAFSDYHLRSERGSGLLEAKSSTTYSLILAGVALLVLLIACFNFMNLTIGNASTRLQEIGVRKVLGAGRRQLIKQFWFESLALSFIALMIGVVLAQVVLPVFNSLSQKAIRPAYLQNAGLWVFLLGLTLFVGLVSGGYPALVLSRFESVKLFRGKAKFTGKNTFSKLLITLQFSISIFLIVSTVIMSRQNSFLVHKDLGYDSDRVLVVPLEDVSSGAQMQQAVFPVLKTRLLQYDNIVSVTGARYDMAHFWMTHAPNLKEGERVLLDYNHVDYDFLTTLGLRLVEGRDFSPDFPSDLENAVIVNETFVKRFGMESPLGRSISEPFQEDPEGTIIGVVEDFHYQSLHQPIRPVYIRLAGGRRTGGPPPPAGAQNKMRPVFTSEIKHMYVKLKGRNFQAALGNIQKEFKELVPGIPFAYSFLDEAEARQYVLEERWGRIINYASVFAVLIACSGLFGITLLAVARRTKEIGIRKVMGASVLQIARLINREFVLLVILANVLAWPAGYFAMKALLQNYAFRISIQPWFFLFSGVLALAIALFTVSVQALRAARSNPVDALRYE